VLRDLWKLTINTSSLILGNGPPSVEWFYLGGSIAAGFNNSGNFGVYGVQNVSDGNNWPGAREYHTLQVTSDGTELYLFGGNGYASQNQVISELGDLFRYDVLSGNWTWLSGYSTAGTGSEIGVFPVMPGLLGGMPGARYGQIATLDSIGQLYVSQGYGYGSLANVTGDLSDLWRFTPGSGLWTFLKGAIFGTFRSPALIEN
jgi:hypothetical protein